LVRAASITSQMSIPIGSKTSFSSFIRAMLTARKVFSVSLTASATSAEATGTVRATKAP
jgi:hypothetical protein